MSEKVTVIFRHTGDAPILKKKRWLVGREQNIAALNDFLKCKLLNCHESETLFLYINHCFSPAPDVLVGELYDCYGSDGSLVMHYCKSQAWG